MRRNNLKRFFLLYYALHIFLFGFIGARLSQFEGCEMRAFIRRMRDDESLQNVVSVVENDSFSAHHGLVGRHLLFFVTVEVRKLPTCMNI